MDNFFEDFNLQREINRILNSDVLSYVFEITLSFPVDMKFVKDFNISLKDKENDEDSCNSYIILKEGLMIPRGWTMIDTWVSPDNDTIVELGIQEYDEPFGVLSIQFMRTSQEVELFPADDEYEN